MNTGHKGRGFLFGVYSQSNIFTDSWQLIKLDGFILKILSA
jgi:hypothetical protein